MVPWGLPRVGADAHTSERRETQGTQFRFCLSVHSAIVATIYLISHERDSPVSDSSLHGRHARLLQLLYLLQSGTGFDAPQLADQWGVCRRTIYRDLSLVRKAGIELDFDPETKCYRLAPRHDITVTPSLGAEELTTLVTAVHFSLMRGLPDYRKTLERSTALLLSHSSHDIRHSVIRLTDSCAVRTPDQQYSTRDVRIMHHILQATGQRRKLMVTLYERFGGKPLDTRLAPYQVIAASDTWQVIGRSSFHQAVRTFDPREIQSAVVTDEAYAIPRGYRSGR